MTWTLKLRGDPTGTLIHEYLCPVHGRFEAEVSRADVPDEMPCPETLDPYHDWASERDAAMVRLREGDDSALPIAQIAGDMLMAASVWPVRANHCGLTSPWSPSGVTSRVKQGEVVQGKVETAGLPDHVCMSTRELADGMPLSEFKAKRAKLHQDLAVRRMRQLTGRGGKVFR